MKYDNMHWSFSLFNNLSFPPLTILFLQISYSVCAKIPAANNIWETESRNRKNTKRAVSVERSENNRGRVVSESHTYAAGDTAKVECIRSGGVSERKKQSADT